MFNIYDSLCGKGKGKGKGPILMFIMGTPTLKKMTKLDLGPTVFKLHYFYHFNEEIFVSFIR